MPERARLLHPALAGLCLLLVATPVPGQDLDPRAYARVPVGMTFVVAGFSYSHGGVVTEATSTVQNVQADVKTPSLAVGHVFSLFDRTAQAFVVLPYSWAQASGEVGGETHHITRSGLSDMRFRLSLLLLGGPAARGEEFAKVPNETILGASLTVSAPVGQFFPAQAINLGTNRWAFKPEAALSHPVGERWRLDFYTAVWLFTPNDSYYPGTSSRTQDPLVAFQGHVSYTLQPQMWVAFDLTYYVGGLSYVDGIGMDDRQDNSRIGGTLVLPVGRTNSLKFSGSTGAIIRFGADFTTLAVGWQMSFF